jgi:hypothetical protein
MVRRRSIRSIQAAAAFARRTASAHVWIVRHRRRPRSSCPPPISRLNRRPLARSPSHSDRIAINRLRGLSTAVLTVDFVGDELLRGGIQGGAPAGDVEFALGLRQYRLPGSALDEHRRRHRTLALNLGNPPRRRHGRCFCGGFQVTLVVLAVVVAISVLRFRSLDRLTGAEVSGHRRSPGSGRRH